MTLTITLPDELASQLMALLPEEERDRFAVSAITEALAARIQEREARLAEALLAEIDPESEPEREEAECIAIVEEELKDMDAGRGLVSFEEARRRWAEQKIARRTAKHH